MTNTTTAASDLSLSKFNASAFTTARLMREDPLALFRRVQRENGDYVVTVALPGLRTIIVSDPDMVHEILVRRSDEFVKPELGKKMLQSAFGNGIFFSEGDFWKRQRKLAQPAFHHMRIGKYATDMVAHTQKQLQSWANQKSILIDKETHALTLKIVVDALFKTDVTEHVELIGKSMHALSTAVGDQSKSIVQAQLPNWLPTSINRRKKLAADQMNPLIRQMIADRRASAEDRGDLLSMFLQVQDADTGERMSDQQVRDELMTMFIAGHETSALALAWSLVELARHPEVEAKLHAEIDSVLGDRAATLDDLPKLTYTQAVIKEILRFYPPAPFLTRSPAQPMLFHGGQLRTSDLLMVLAYTIHHDARWYADSESFIPERWLDGELEKRLPKCAYLPFGTGPRVCIGNGFAQMEMALVLATIAQHYKLRFPNGIDKVEVMLNLTLSMKPPVEMELIQR
ncbi:MAG: cytochrome P450 [Anaerolineae bacterium]|nr:cytochrome P450 [Anaerolineae bacterium]